MSVLDGLRPRRERGGRLSLRSAAAGFGTALKRRWPGYLATILLLGVAAPTALTVWAVNLAPGFASGWTASAVVLAGSLPLNAVTALAFCVLIHLTLHVSGPPRDDLATVAGAAIMTFPAVFAIALLMGLPNLVLTVPVGLLMGEAQTGQTAVSEVALRILMLRMLGGLASAIIGALLIVPKQVAVAEAVGPITAIRRSWALTRGHRRRLATVALALSAVFWGVHMLADFGSAWLARGDPTRWPVVGLRYLLISPVFLGTIFMTAVYLELRRVKGGDGTDTAAVFD